MESFRLKSTPLQSGVDAFIGEICDRLKLRAFGQCQHCMASPSNFFKEDNDRLSRLREHMFEMKNGRVPSYTNDDVRLLVLEMLYRQEKQIICRFDEGTRNQALSSTQTSSMPTSASRDHDDVIDTAVDDDVQLVDRERRRGGECDDPQMARQALEWISCFQESVQQSCVGPNHETTAAGIDRGRSRTDDYSSWSDSSRISSSSSSTLKSSQSPPSSSSLTTVTAWACTTSDIETYSHSPSIPSSPSSDTWDLFSALNVDRTQS